MGNYVVNPSKGKMVPKVVMSNGRQDLFDVMNQTGRRREGDVSSDSWIGNRAIDPTKGKQAITGPERPNGRTVSVPPLELPSLKPERKQAEGLQ